MNKETPTVVKLYIVTALFFYAVSWSVNQYGNIAWYIGIGLPWLSLLVGIPVMLVSDSVFKKHLTSKISWGYLYAFCTIVYVIVMTIITKTIFPFIPHLAACVCFIASTYIDLIHKDIKKETKYKEETIAFLENKLESIERLVIQTEETKDDKTKKKLLDLIYDQAADSFRTLEKFTGQN